MTSEQPPQTPREATLPERLRKWASWREDRYGCEHTRKYDEWCPVCLTAEADDMNEAASALLAASVREQEQAELMSQKLAACDVAALSNTPETYGPPIHRDNPFWSPAYESVRAAVLREIQERGRADQAEAHAAALRRLLTEIVAMVRGECPSLLSEDSGGDARLSLAIDAALHAPSDPAASVDAGERPTPLVLAERIAREAHKGQLDTVTGEPYITHVERVVRLVDGDDAKVVAWLHDVVEDNPAWTLERLEAEGIPPRLIRPVSLLTRRRPHAYADYIEDIRAAGEPLAAIVKIADLRDHLHPNCPERLRPRYEKALASLSPAAPPKAETPTETDCSCQIDAHDYACPIHGEGASK